MYNNIQFYNNIDEIDLNNYDKDTTYILIDNICGISVKDICENNKEIIYNFPVMETNICFYFGYNDFMKKNMTKNSIKYLISNVIQDNVLCNLINEHYKNNNYTKNNRDILNSLYKNIILLHNKIEIDYKYALKKKYELDIVNKAVVEYFEANLNNIMDNYFLKIKLFYILSIILETDYKTYILIYDDIIINQLKNLLEL